jgi:hypothetical protein
MKIGLPLLVCSALWAPAWCAAHAAGAYAADVFVSRDIVTEPAPGNFSVCHGGTCTIVSAVSFDDRHWAEIAAAFPAPARDAAEERARIAEAISRFERVVGALTGTADDRAGNRRGRDWESQMDCIDESTNTTTYLRLLARAGLLRWHRVEARATRGFFVFGWPHTTAVVSELNGGAKWAVDSWFFENGRPPAIVPLALWRTGWRPRKDEVNPPLSADGRR